MSDINIIKSQSCGNVTPHFTVSVSPPHTRKKYSSGVAFYAHIVTQRQLMSVLVAKRKPRKRQPPLATVKTQFDPHPLINLFCHFAIYVAWSGSDINDYTLAILLTIFFHVIELHHQWNIYAS